MPLIVEQDQSHQSFAEKRNLYLKGLLVSIAVSVGGCVAEPQDDAPPARQEDGAAAESDGTGGATSPESTGEFSGGASSTGGAPFAPSSGDGGPPSEGSGGSIAEVGGTGGDATLFQGPAKILCLGDSITEQDNSWIHPMQRGIIAAGCGDYELLGYDQSPYNGPYNAPEGLQSKRIAAGGFSSRGILNWITSKGGDVGGDPDVWIQYLGVNNVYGGFIDGTYNPNVSGDAVGAYIADTTAFVGMARDRNPHATILLMKLQNGGFSEINGAIDTLVGSLSTGDSPVIAVAGASDVSTVDGIHPDASGADKLAEPVTQTLVSILKELGACE